MPKVVRVMPWFLGVFSLMPLVMPGKFYTAVLFVFQIIMFSSCSYVVICYAKVAIKHDEGARLGFLGVVILMFVVVYDIFVASSILPPPYIGPFGTTVFILIQSLIIGKRFAKAFRLSEKLSCDLQVEVDRQTRDIKSMLANIRQGIFTIMPQGNRIHPNFSAHLESILETNIVPNQDAMDILFKETLNS